VPTPGVLNAQGQAPAQTVHRRWRLERKHVVIVVALISVPIIVVFWKIILALIFLMVLAPLSNVLLPGFETLFIRTLIRSIR